MTTEPQSTAARVARFLFWPRLSLVGIATAVIFFVASVTPSLLPREWMFQGVISGISVAVGYGVGTALAAIATRLGVPQVEPATRRRAWWVLGVVGAVLITVALWWGDRINDETRSLMGVEDSEAWELVSIVVIAALVAGVLVVLGRALRGLVRIAARFLERWIPPAASTAVAFITVILLLVGVLDGVVIEGVFEGVNSTYSLTDDSTTDGITQPASSLRSGSTESLVAWDTLGKKGRDFVGDGGDGGDIEAGPTAAEVEAFTGEPALEPIRVYVGIRSAGSLDERVELALDEMERTDAFERRAVGIYVATGTGWVDERAVDSFEYIWGGDTASVSMQYSYLPSWVSVLVDGEKATDASRALIEAVMARVSEMPEEDQPSVFLFGESLGSFAVESAFADLDDMNRDVDGALLVGPTFGNPLRNHFIANRDEGSPVWRPLYEEGRAVRFAVQPEDLEPLTEPWEAPRIVYLQNSSDPVSFFGPEVIWSRPDWLERPRGPDVSPDMVWFPGVTFFQLLADLSFSFGAPVGHGHRYGANVVDAWIEIEAPDGWTAQDTQELREIIGHD